MGPDLPNSLPIRPDLAAIAILTARAIEQEDGLTDKLIAGQPVLVIKTGDKEHVPLVGSVASSCCIGADRKVQYSNTKRKGSGECIVIEAKDARRTSVSLYDDDVLEALGAGCSLVGISPDPETLLPKTLLRAADHRISLPKLDASAIRLTIATLIGAVPEAGISDDVAARLDVTDLAVAVRPGRTADDCIAALKKITDGNAADGPRGPRLDDLPGYGAARVWGLEAAEDLNALKGGRIAWADFDHRGLLLSGAPGTGKTLFATALANSAGVPLIATSVASWSTKSYLSGTLQAMEQAFRNAEAAAPSILFIDELDGISSRANLRGENVEYWSQVVNRLLELLQGVEKREGVVVIAATNHPERIDPAVLRAGRLDRHIAIGMPDIPDLKALYRHYVGPALSDSAVTRLAVASAGCTGADIDAFVRRARSTARRQDRALAEQDLFGEVNAARPPLHQNDRAIVAVHEAGHAVAYRMLGMGRFVQLAFTRSGGHLVVDHSLTGMARKADLEKLIVVSLAGRAAEELLFGEFSTGCAMGDASDLAKATELAIAIELSFEELVFFAGTAQDALMHVPGMRDRLQKRLQSANLEAQALVRRNRPLLERIADCLLTESYIDHARFEEICSGFANAPANNRECVEGAAAC